MRILALETTDKTGSVAALNDCNLLSKKELGHTQRSAQSLAPAVHALLEQVGWLPSDVQLVAVSVGPGSFTGLRVGVTMAKIFAYTVGADILGINTLEAVAAGVQESGWGGSSFRWGGSLTATPTENSADRPFVVSTVMDAQRGDVVEQSFSREKDGGMEPLGPQRLLAAEQWLAELTPGVVVTGPALVKLSERLPPGVRALDRSDWFPRAEAVGRLAARYHAQGRRDDLWKLVPHYCRRSAAEEKLESMKNDPHSGT
jgi:tRNA threonylcarbamoyladenosine biosynthesis protein TsaB